MGAMSCQWLPNGPGVQLQGPAPTSPVTSVPATGSTIVVLAIVSDFARVVARLIGGATLGDEFFGELHHRAQGVADFVRLQASEAAMKEAVGREATAVRSQNYYLDVTPPAAPLPSPAGG